MSQTLRTGQWLALWGLVWGVSQQGVAQTAYVPQAGEYAIAGRLLGDQTHPQIAENSSGGFLVWQDNATDGDGLGISAQRLSSNASAVFNPIRVNELGSGDQENPQVALLPNGGAVFVWQGGTPGFQKIYARFLKTDNTFATGDVLVNSFTNNFQVAPVVTVLADGTVVIAWASYEQELNGQSGANPHYLGVFARRFSSTGAKLGDEFQVNQFVDWNQQNPAAATLSNGNFILVWTSEQQRFARSVDVYARIFKPTGEAVANEFLVNSSTNICANPSVIGTPGGGFVVTWGENNMGSPSNGWDIVARAFNASAKPASDTVPVNTYTFGDQIGPKLNAIGSDCLIAWTSLAQDGSWEGIYGQFMTANGQLTGGEFRVNTTTVSRQIQPAVAADGVNRFVVVWTSFVGGDTSFDLFAQRYSISPDALPKPPVPFTSALSQSRISVTWPALAGYDGIQYAVFVDGGTNAIVVTNIQWTLTQLVPSSTHSFRLMYQLADGRTSPLSDAVTATTWGEDLNGDGLPDDWQALYWGNDPSKWPAGNIDSDGDGATNLQEFLAGTIPTDPASVLKTSLVSTGQGWRLRWNTQPGFVYQVQVSSNVNSWVNLDGPRFAAGTEDSIPVDGTHDKAYYRLVRMR